MLWDIYMDSTAEWVHYSTFWMIGDTVGISPCQGIGGISPCYSTDSILSCQGPVGISPCQGTIGISSCQGTIGISSCQGTVGILPYQGPVGISPCQGTIGLIIGIKKIENGTACNPLNNRTFYIQKRRSLHPHSV